MHYFNIPSVILFYHNQLEERYITVFDFMKHEEKKVEYIELIYDLIFVYLIGRNNSMVGHISGGFIDPSVFLTYVLCTLITIQIWYLTTLFINRYGDNGLSEYIGLFINMFLLYYMGDATRVHWQALFYRYNIAWALILLNLMVQYLIKYRKAASEAPWEKDNILFFVRMLAAMIAVIAVGIPLYAPLGVPLTPVAMLTGIVFTVAGRKRLDLVAVDFPHLTERVMLYVVFTFGEMIIAISVYFEETFTLTTFYYALCAFLIVAGLFTSYGFLYDRLLDREMTISGNTYMLLHIFIIFSLSSLTLSLEFMHEPEIALVPKTVYLIASFTMYYVFMFALAPFIKQFSGGIRNFRTFIISLVIFIVLMAALYRHPALSIMVSVLMTFWIWYLEYLYWKRIIVPAEEQECVSVKVH